MKGFSMDEAGMAGNTEFSGAVRDAGVTGTGGGTGTVALQGQQTRRSLGQVLVLGILSVLAMTTCCVLPLLLVSIGVTGVFIGQLSSLYQYHWYFLAFASASLAYGFWKAYRPVDQIACADGVCARPMNRTAMRVVLWISLAMVVGALAFQYVAPSLLSPF